MLHSVNSRHDADASRDADGATVACGDRGLFAAGLASPWSLGENLPAMDQSAYGRYDPPSTPAAFLSPSSFPPPPQSGVYRATTAAVGDLLCRPPPRQVDVDATPPYFVGDRRLPPDVLDRAVYGGMYRDVTGGGGVPGGRALDDRDCQVRSVLLAGDALRRTPAGLTPPPSMFAWRGGQTGFSSEHDAVRGFQSYYTNITVDTPSCRSPVSADRKCVVHFSPYNRPRYTVAQKAAVGRRYSNKCRWP